MIVARLNSSPVGIEQNAGGVHANIVNLSAMSMRIILLVKSVLRSPAITPCEPQKMRKIES